MPQISQTSGAFAFFADFERGASQMGHIPFEERRAFLAEAFKAGLDHRKQFEIELHMLPNRFATRLIVVQPENAPPVEPDRVQQIEIEYGLGEHRNEPTPGANYNEMFLRSLDTMQAALETRQQSVFNQWNQSGTERRSMQDVADRINERRRLEAELEKKQKELEQAEEYARIASTPDDTQPIRRIQV